MKFSMKKSILSIVVLSLALLGCGEKSEPTVKTLNSDVTAGKALAEKTCKACHGANGGSVAPAIPHLAAQRERYLLASLNEYKNGKRTHAALRDIANQMSEADMRNVAAYFASLPPVANITPAEVKHTSPYEKGKVLAVECAKCHGEDGNAKAPGTPTLAGQQPHYLIAAVLEYHRDDRKVASMKSITRDSDRLDLESLALYYSAQTPVQRTIPTRGDAVVGEPLSAMCGGCHGAKGVSVDAATPSLAGQDAQYLIKATKAYRTTRQNWGMQRYVSNLSDKDIDNIAAFYATQQPKVGAQIASSTQELAAKCDRCHDQNDNAAAAPKMKGQDKDYLVMALRSYRDGKRDSTAMHNMSYPYSNAIIESLASWYASQTDK
jgi:cytochrome c553